MEAAYRALDIVPGIHETFNVITAFSHCYSGIQQSNDIEETFTALSTTHYPPHTLSLCDISRTLTSNANDSSGGISLSWRGSTSPSQSLKSRQYAWLYHVHGPREYPVHVIGTIHIPSTAPIICRNLGFCRFRHHSPALARLDDRPFVPLNGMNGPSDQMCTIPKLYSKCLQLQNASFQSIPVGASCVLFRR